MRPSNPGVATDNLHQHISVAKVLSGNVSLGSASVWDANGVPTTYKQDNGEGVLIRHLFAAANADEVIMHNLDRIPVGYILTRSNTAVVVYDAMTNVNWTKKQIVIRANAVADCTIYIF